MGDDDDDDDDDLRFHLLSTSWKFQNHILYLECEFKHAGELNGRESEEVICM